jgi:hypothetical protein
MEKEMAKIVLDRFKFVTLVKDWAYFLKTTEEAKFMNQSEVIKKAMEDILSDKVTMEDIEKGNAKVKAIPVKTSEIGEIFVPQSQQEVKDGKAAK